MMVKITPLCYFFEKVTKRLRKNDKTKRALDELEKREGKSFKNVDELFDDLDS